MNVNNKLQNLYKNYYLNKMVINKRIISSRQSLNHLFEILPHHNYYSVIDIGAGDGSLLEELDKTNIGTKLHAIEISDSGYETIKKKKFSKYVSVDKFDGYNISGYYNLGLATHVLEHVEHERQFINEIARTCDYFYIEVPLELTLKVNKNIKISSKYGHINFYNLHTFRNLLESCNLELISIRIFSASLEYEKHISGFFLGIIKYFLKKCALKIAPNLAQLFFTYMSGAYCQSRRLQKTTSIK